MHSKAIWGCCCFTSAETWGVCAGIDFASVLDQGGQHVTLDQSKCIDVGALTGIGDSMVSSRNRKWLCLLGC